MNGSPNYRTLNDRSRVEEVVRQFESEFHERPWPKIEQYLSLLPDLTSQLLPALLVAEIRILRRRGEQPTPEDYRARFPDRGNAIDAAFAERIVPSCTETETQVKQAASTDKKVTVKPGPNVASTIERIGEYRVLNTIAVHGQGAVYRANHPHLNRLVVIKVSKNQVDRAHQEHVVAEGRVLASLSHPNLAQVYDLQFDGGRPYLVMEYIDGRNLAEQIKENPLEPKDAAELVATLARAIHYAHSMGVVHQDLKPANVVIRGADGTPKVIDFGLARSKAPYSPEDLFATYGGTIAYMPPEQAQLFRRSPSDESESVFDERVDVFALGAILYELLNGRGLYQFDEKSEGLKLAAECDFDRNFPIETPAYVRAACLKALSKHPADRFRTAEQFAEALTARSTIHRILVPLVIAAVLFIGIGLAFVPGAASGVSEASTPAAPSVPTTVPASTTGFGVAGEVLPGVCFYHYANKDEFGVKGELFKNGPVLQDDDLRIEAKFKTPTYCFLFALNPDGAVQLCYPEGGAPAWDVKPTGPISELVYPADSGLAFSFTDGVGQQAFILVRSPKPLPSFRTWLASTRILHDSLADTKGNWIWHQGEVRSGSLADNRKTRSAPRKLRGYAPFEELMKEMGDSNPDQQLSGVSFPVEAQ